jgi:hypothetical protein
MLSDITAFVRYAMGLPDFLRQTISLDEARENIQQHMANRKDNFLRLIKKGVVFMRIPEVHIRRF